MANQPKKPFAKPPTSYSEQVKLLQSRGMTFADESKAAFYLQHLNYYRLAAYWLPFESDHASHTFQTNTAFETVLQLYVFDRELRLLVLDAIERIEVSIRSQWAYQMAHQHGTHSHLDASLTSNAKHWLDNLALLAKEVHRSSETFIKHLTNTYNEALPPVWAVSEVMSLGLLSRWYANLKPMPTRRAIASVYLIDEQTLQSWLQHLTLIRNTCAHHSRLWNREFTMIPAIPRNKPKGLKVQCATGSRKIYNTLIILLHCMDVVAPEHHWRARLKDLLQKNLSALSHMDFPANWNSMPIWMDSP